MDTKQLITFAVNKEIEETFKSKPEILKFLLNHERKHLLIDNLCKEIRICELRPSLKFEAEDIIKLGIEFARSFASAALKYKEKEVMSDIFRMEELKARQKQQYEEMLEHAPIEELTNGMVTEAER